MQDTGGKGSKAHWIIRQSRFKKARGKSEGGNDVREVARRTV